MHSICMDSRALADTLAALSEVTHSVSYKSQSSYFNSFQLSLTSQECELRTHTAMHSGSTPGT